jgi:cytochrome c-type biogenesis protein CcmH
LKLKHKTARFLQVAALILAATLLVSAGPSDDTRVSVLGHQMMCMCGCNQILAECNHVGCSYSTKMLGQIREAVLRGDSDAAIKKMMVDEYGTVVLAAPTTKGFDIVAWIMPFAIFLLALGAVVVVIRTWKRRAAPVPATAPASPDVIDSYRKLARKETEF